MSPCAEWQTSSGKTHTMTGSRGAGPGIMPRSLDLLFEAMAVADPGAEFTIRVRTSGVVPDEMDVGHSEAWLRITSGGRHDRCLSPPIHLA
jgi:hypothetical protein